MPRYLIVANLTLGGDHLLKEVHERATADPESRFHILVPASSKQEGFHPVDEEQSAVAAQRRLHEGIARISSLKVKEVTGQVGTSRPFEAVGDVIRSNPDDPFDEIILSTLPSGPSKWLAMDLPSRINRNHDIPLTHVEAQSA